MASFLLANAMDFWKKDVMHPFRLLFCLTVFLAAVSFRISAQEASDQDNGDEGKVMQEIEKFGWIREGKGKLTHWAEIAIPEGYRFTDASGANKLLTFTQNVPGDSTQGVIAPEDFSWWALFRFVEDGYVKDDDKDKLNPSKLLKDMQSGQKAANEYRKEQGLDELEITGWAQEPAYNAQTNNLEWGLHLLSSDGGQSVNFETKLLGRKGYMEAVLVCGPEELPKVMPEFQKILEGYHYVPGEAYADYKPGDKIAKYGLTALIAGGGAAIAAKTGLLAALGKLIAKGGKAIFAVIAVAVAAVGRVFKRLFGRSGE
ncbi:MAG: DUF2167 domain-containing protein [Verrucomicrobiales bacterium]